MKENKLILEYIHNLEIFINFLSLFIKFNKKYKMLRLLKYHLKIFLQKKKIKLNFKEESCERNFKAENINKIHITILPKIS